LIEELQKELIRLSSTNVKYDDVADEIMRLRALKQDALT
jgi:hypothetical protein